jgi:hypothetical protein
LALHEYELATLLAIERRGEERREARSERGEERRGVGEGGRDIER